MVRPFPEDRYRTDPQFRQLVDMLESIVHHAQLTPFEIREAAMLACIHYEMRSPVRAEVPKDWVLSSHAADFLSDLRRP